MIRLGAIPGSVNTCHDGGIRNSIHKLIKRSIECHKSTTQTLISITLKTSKGPNALNLPIWLSITFDVILQIQ